MMPKTSLEGSTVRVDLHEDGPGLSKAELDAFLEEGKGGFTVEQLSEASDAVKNEEHWKNPVDAIVAAKMRGVLEKAIPWYTGTEATFEDADEPGQIRVTAPGYYGGPCN